MAFLFDDPNDGFRLLVLFLCIACSVGLIYRTVRPPSPDWNSKTKDYWFALFMWSLAGSAATIETLINNEPFTVRLAFIFVASVVCLNGLRQKGSWGIRREK